jgi:N4-bis(aminopropyl)spermidine synthase
MKAGDMVLQSEFVAQWADGKRLAFIGDGDAISLCVAYLRRLGILGYGPSHLAVFDFDERICNSIARFAESQEIEAIEANLYNCVDPFPRMSEFDCFYTNPPWGRSNAGSSVRIFMQRGMEAAGYAGEGVVLLADDPALDWSRQVLANVERHALQAGYYVGEMIPQRHEYHLDDNPRLRSCNLLLRSVSGRKRRTKSVSVSDSASLADFYGKDQPARVQYVRERHVVGYGQANADEYSLEELNR